jgi:Ni/Co efflux regulator RcnB
MKRIALALAAFSILAAPMAAQAQPGYGNQVEYRHFHKPDPRYQYRKPAPRPYWVKGRQLPAWQRKHVVREYHRYGLKRPGRGQEWVRVDNSYLLINVASGIIAGVIAGR